MLIKGINNLNKALRYILKKNLCAFLSNIYLIVAITRFSNIDLFLEGRT